MGGRETGTKAMEYGGGGECFWLGFWLDGGAIWMSATWLPGCRPYSTLTTLLLSRMGDGGVMERTISTSRVFHTARAQEPDGRARTAVYWFHKRSISVPSS
jgi:hypothetical protein